MDYMIENIFQIFGTVIGTLLVWYFKDILKTLGVLTKSVNELNIRMAELVKEHMFRKEEITEIKSKLAHLESRSHK